MASTSLPEPRELCSGEQALVTIDPHWAHDDVPVAPVEVTDSDKYGDDPELAAVLAEAEKQGLIADSGKRKLDANGKLQVVWIRVPRRGEMH